jgi:CheY-like chemotaxis protein
LPRAEEPIVEHNTIVGCSILVVEEEPFVARCLQIFLEGMGAKVHYAARAVEAMQIIDRKALSAGVLSSDEGCRPIAQRLSRLGLPFVLCRDVADASAWPGTPFLAKPVAGFQLVQVLCRLMGAERAAIGGPQQLVVQAT